MSARVRSVASRGLVVLAIAAAGLVPAVTAKAREKAQPEQTALGRLAAKLSSNSQQAQGATANAKVRPARTSRAAARGVKKTAQVVKKGKGGQSATKAKRAHAAARGGTRRLRAQAEARRRARAGYSPPSAAIVVDANSGTVLADSNPDAIRHPASLTKIMTLYLLFEQLETGKLKLDSPIVFSAYASSRPPTKLGVKPGESITVEEAIKALVTKSANDAAAAIGESIGGDERTFARMMTRKARALGMDQTVYVNASGLPDPAQVTSARDQAILGRAIQDRFPDYYRYFRTTAFRFRGGVIGNHNKLLGSVAGVDGIKTGFTEASGFNLVTSIHRGGRFLVAVVLGGSTARARDDRMRGLIAQYIDKGATRRTAPAIVETIALAGDPSAAADVVADSMPSAPAASVTESATSAGAAASAAPYKVVRTRAVIPADDPPASPAPQPPQDAAAIVAKRSSADAGIDTSANIKANINANINAGPVDPPPGPSRVSVAVVAQGDADPASDGEITAGEVASASMLPDVGGTALKPILLVLGISLAGVFGLQFFVVTSRRRATGQA